MLVLVFVRGRFSGVEAPADEASDSPLAGFALIRRDRVLGAVVIAGALFDLAAAYCSIADLPLAIDELGAGETGYGLLVAAWGVGTTLGALVARRAMQRLGVERAFTVACSSRASRSRSSPSHRRSRSPPSRSSPAA